MERFSGFILCTVSVKISKFPYQDFLVDTIRLLRLSNFQRASVVSVHDETGMSVMKHITEGFR